MAQTGSGSLALKPPGQFRIVIFRPGQLDDADDGVGVPIELLPLPVASREMRHAGVRVFADVARVVEFVPELLPNRFEVLASFERAQQRTRVDRCTAPAF